MTWPGRYIFQTLPYDQSAHLFFVSLFVCALAAIWTAAQSKDCNSALEILTEMKGHDCAPTIESYNGVIAALSSCGQAEEAVSVFREMKKENPNLMTDFTSFFHLACAIRKIRGDEEKLALLWRVYAKMGSRERQVDVGGRVIEALIAAYGSLGHFDEAMNAFESIKGPSDAECLRAILFACSLANPPEWETALSLLHTSDIVRGGEGPALVEPGALCNAMLACSKADKWEESLQLLRLYGGKRASTCAVNSLIAACGRGGRADMSMEVLYEMEQYGLQPDERSYRNAIIACNQAEHEQRRSNHRRLNGSEERPLQEGFGWWECAISLLRRMKESGLRPDTPTLSSAISSCEAARQWQLALEILQSAMDEEFEDDDTSGHGLNLYCFNAALAACEKGGAWVEALEIYERMKEQGGQELRPNIVTLSSLILALDNAGQKELAVSMLEEGLQRKFVKSPWRFTADSASGKSIRAIDLHSFCCAMTRAAIRSHMDSLMLLTDSHAPELAEDLTIIVGKGLRSEEDPVLKKTVLSLLETEYGITADIDSQNAGRLLVRSDKLRQFVASRSW